ncbi:MAG: laccase domain-containing protein, partial [Acidimicrobiales bacterium]|nr:laccase domain-containing protein [Acidimicrobiales bacterium]
MARELVRRSLPSGRTARVIMSEAADGDLAVGGPEDLLTSRRKEVVAGPWAWVHQVHGTTVIDVSEPGRGSGSSADALVTTTTVAPLAIQVADCVPVALIAPAGVVAIAHAGWRGLAAG